MTGADQSRVTTLRVPQDLYDDLVAVARIDGQAVSVVVRRAVADHIARRKSDPAFRAAAAAQIARDQALLASITDQTGDAS